MPEHENHQRPHKGHSQRPAADDDGRREGSAHAEELARQLEARREQLKAVAQDMRTAQRERDLLRLRLARSDGGERQAVAAVSAERGMRAVVLEVLGGLAERLGRVDHDLAGAMQDEARRLSIIDGARALLGAELRFLETLRVESSSSGSNPGPSNEPRPSSSAERLAVDKALPLERPWSDEEGTGQPHPASGLPAVSDPLAATRPLISVVCVAEHGATVVSVLGWLTGQRWSRWELVIIDVSPGGFGSADLEAIASDERSRYMRSPGEAHHAAVERSLRLTRGTWLVAADAALRNAAFLAGAIDNAEVMSPREPVPAHTTVLISRQTLSDVVARARFVTSCLKCLALPELLASDRASINGHHGPAALKRSGGRRALRVGYVLWSWPVVSHSFVINEVRWLQRHGIDVHVMHAAAPAHPDRPATLDFEVDTVCAPTLDDMAREGRRRGITHLHTHFFHPTVPTFTQPLADRLDLPFSFMGHGIDLFDRSALAAARLPEVGRSSRLHTVFAPGTFHGDFLIAHGVPAERVLTCRAMSDLAFFDDGLERTGPIRRVAAIARFVEKKGLATLVEAMRFYDGPTLDVRLHGYGPLDQELRRQAADVPCVSIEEGPQTPAATREILAGADLFVLPCRTTASGDSDGLPIALMEAMAAGVPVLTTAVASIPDLVKDGETGFLVTPSDPGALAGALARIVTLPQPRLRQVSDAARRHVRAQFYPDVVYPALVERWLS
jgi:glycosyltransferase involved in cell wall biosynthesis